MATTPPPLESIPVTAFGQTDTVVQNAQPAPPLPEPRPVARTTRRRSSTEVLTQVNELLIVSPPWPFNPENDATTLVNQIVNNETGSLTAPMSQLINQRVSDISEPPPIESIPSTSSGSIGDRSLNTTPEVVVEPAGSTPDMSLGLSRSPSSNETESSRSSVVTDPWAGENSYYAFGLDTDHEGMRPRSECFFLFNSILRKIKKPKVAPSSATLSKKKGCYIVPWLNKFYYHKIQPVQEVNNFLYKFSVRPDTLKEGLVCINKDLYYVTYKDLIRGVIRKSRKVEIKSGSTYADLLTLNSTRVESKQTASRIRTRKTSEKAKQSSPEVRVLTENERGLVGQFGLEICKSVDLAHAEQERTLLYSLSEEEEDWEIS